ncbi:hypothetical protein [Dielma fastidiosa]|uniref:Uncharacterized protein n=1 Tax=Dielma fastidiosa TaxID=1034346 RepID=A0AB35UMF0_9FIRM|nr:hypothetical protein [Dielma fastidiosa]MDY5168121.1 hypothetical protein [Dielma fastidiosa]
MPLSEKRKKMKLMLEAIEDVYDRYEFVLAVGSILKTDEGAEEMIKFLEDHPVTDSDEVLLKALDIDDKYKEKQRQFLKKADA